MLNGDSEKIEFLSGNEVIKNRVVNNALKYLHNLETTLKKLGGTVGSFPDKNQKVIDGEAYVVSDMYNPEEELEKMPNDKVLIITQTYPNYVPYMRKARAIVADVGGITSHAAIVSRELKIPCIVGTKIATKKLKNGDSVRINLEEGTIEKVK
jgi:pyruvate,water dikinase